MATVTERITKIIGYERMALICEEIGGERWYIPKVPPVNLRNEQIKREFNHLMIGKDNPTMGIYSALAKKYDISLRQCRRICSDNEKLDMLCTDLATKVVL